MRKILIIFALLFLSVYSAGAVNYAVTIEDSVKSGQPGEGIEEGGFIKNICDHDIVMSVNRISNDIPSGWTTTLCVGSTCYGSDISSVNEVVPVGDSILYSITFHTDSQPGSGQSILQFFELGGDPGTEEHLYTAVTETSSLFDEPNLQISSARLFGNFPNPFNPRTVISYQLSVANNVELSVYNINGRQVTMLIREKQRAGKYNVPFNAGDLPSGTYLYRLKAGNKIQTGKMLLIK